MPLANGEFALSNVAGGHLGFVAPLQDGTGEFGDAEHLILGTGPGAKSRWIAKFSGSGAIQSTDGVTDGNCIAVAGDFDLGLLAATAYAECDGQLKKVASDNTEIWSVASPFSTLAKGYATSGDYVIGVGYSGSTVRVKVLSKIDGSTVKTITLPVPVGYTGLEVGGVAAVRAVSAPANDLIYVALTATAERGLTSSSSAPVT